MWYLLTLSSVEKVYKIMKNTNMRILSNSKLNKFVKTSSFDKNLLIKKQDKSVH